MSTMKEDFEKVKKVIETTTTLSQFPALKNLVNGFINKWNPLYLVENPDMRKLLTPDFRTDYSEYSNYLRLKVDFEKNCKFV